DGPEDPGSGCGPGPGNFVRPEHRVVVFLARLEHHHFTGDGVNAGALVGHERAQERFVVALLAGAIDGARGVTEPRMGPEVRTGGHLGKLRRAATVAGPRARRNESGKAERGA